MDPANKMDPTNLNLIRVIPPNGKPYFYVCGNEDLTNLSPYAFVYKRDCTDEELWGVNGIITRQRILGLNKLL